MAYRFRLETLLTFRRNLEEQAQLQLARELQVLAERQARLVDLRDSRERMIDEFEERKQQSLRAALFSFYMEAIRGKEREIEALLAAIAAQEQVVAAARLQLQERVKSRKVIEKAREKDYQRFLHDFRRAEQKESDEQAILRSGRDDLLL